MTEINDSKSNIVNFPFLSSNIPQSPAYGVYVSQLIRYARASSAYSDFLVRSRLLTRKLLGQGYDRFKLITTFKKFYAVIMISLENSNIRSLIWSLTCFLRLYFCDDMVLLAPLQPDQLKPILTLCTCAFYSQCTFY